MKYLKIYGLFLCMIGLFSCDPEVPVITQTANLGISKPYLQIVSPTIDFQAGTESYTIEFNIINSDNAFSLTEVNAYSTFTNAGTGNVSDRMEFKTYSPGGDSKTVITEVVTYEDLRAGLGLPDNQADLDVGSGWFFDFEGVQSDGSVISLSGNVRLTVQSRFAGFYEVVESNYFRELNDGTPLEDFGGWNGIQVLIGSVNATTFSYNDRWGYFAWGGNSFTFSVDEATNEITVPLLTPDGLLANGNDLFSGNYAAGCHTEPGIFTHAPAVCDNTNTLVPDDVTGKHEITLTYGYVSNNGPRTFYEKMVKVVD